MPSGHRPRNATLKFIYFVFFSPSQSPEVPHKQLLEVLTQQRELFARLFTAFDEFGGKFNDLMNLKLRLADSIGRLQE